MTTLSLPPTIIEQAVRTDPRLLSPHSHRQYIAALNTFETWRDGRPMTKTLVESYAAHLHDQDYAPTTINQKLATIRWWARKVIDLAYDNLPEQEAAHVSKQAARVLTVPDVKGSRPQRGRHLKGSELVALIRACLADPTPAGKRDAALLATVWTTGLRRAELAGLRLEDLTPMEDIKDDGTIEHYAELRVVKGKGGKPRTAYLINGAYAALQDWLKVRGDAPGFIFCPVRKGGVPSPSYTVSGEALRKILAVRHTQAGLKKAITWHDFRRTFTGNLLDDGNDLATVQALLGHASPTTTAAYDRRPERVRLAAVKGLKMPQVKP